MESIIEIKLKETINFPVPTILVSKDEIKNLVIENPFKKIKIHKDLILYISFLKEESKIKLTLPYFSKDKNFQILSVQNKTVFSTLDLSISKTPKGMEELEKLFGKNITTRNKDTILKLFDLN